MSAWTVSSLETSLREIGQVVINHLIRRLVSLTAHTGNPISVETPVLRTLSLLVAPSLASLLQDMPVMITNPLSSATTWLTLVKELVPTSTPTQLLARAPPATRVATSPPTRIEMVVSPRCTTLRTFACMI